MKLSTPNGHLDITAHLTGKVSPGVASMYHDYPGADINELIEADYQDPISGYPGFKSLLCEVEKINEQDGGQ